jgi:rRNA biogenesis protein RRP5
VCAFFVFSENVSIIMDLFQVKSKLDVLSSYADAKIGLVTHGWITHIEKHGCFVKFYNGVQGFVSRLISPFPISEEISLAL